MLHKWESFGVHFQNPHWVYQKKKKTDYDSFIMVKQNWYKRLVMESIVHRVIGKLSILLLGEYSTALVGEVAQVINFLQFFLSFVYVIFMKILPLLLLGLL